MKRQSLQLCAIILIALTTISFKSYSQYWKIKGNAGTNPATDFVGTTDAQPLVFRTSGDERVRILSSGKVGIGIKTPTAKLHVIGKDNVSLSSPGYLMLGKVESYNLAFDNQQIQARYNGSYSSLYLNNYGGITYAGSSSTSSYGLVGYGVSYGLYGYASSSTGTGVYGTSYYGLYGTGTYGVYGTGTSYGGYFYNANGTGVYGYDAGSGHGVIGYETGSGEGVDGYAYGSSGWGVYGYSAQSIGVYGNTGNSSSNYAGYFVGNVYCSGTYLGSDQKLKQNINDFSSAMDIIKQLHPKQYQYRQDGNYKLMNLPQGQHYGLIAQDVEKVLPNLVKDSKFDVMKQVEIKVPDPTSTEKNPRPDVTKTIMEKSGETIDYKAVNYTEFIPLLIKGMQEQQQEINALKQQVATLTGNSSSNSKIATLSSAGLLQNVPNPYKNSTTIQYNLPAKFSSAQIIVTDNAGKILKQVNVSGVGKGSININASSLAAGNYNYSLWIDGRLIETKQMVLAK